MSERAPGAWDVDVLPAVDLVASDLDGTLLEPDLGFAADVPPAVAALEEAGVVFAICTGRMLRSARPVAARLGVHRGLIVCYQGAMIADLAGGRVVSHLRMDGDVAAEVVAHVRELGRHVHACIDDHLCVDEIDEWGRVYAERSGVPLDLVRDLVAEIRERAPTKLVVMTDAANVERILPQMRERWRGRLYVTRSQPEYIEFVDASVRKSEALEDLCRRLGLRRERTVACGDGMNDVDMLRWASLGVAVAEADAEVRAVADLVVPRAGLGSLFARLAKARAREAATPPAGT